MLPKRVLVVEDEILIQMYVVNMLKKLGCEIVGAVATGEEAIEIAGEKKPDIIFMDIKLAGKINGFEAVSQLADQNPIPIVFMSAYEIEDEIKKLNYPDRIAFLSKPIELTKLESIIKNF